MTNKKKMLLILAILSILVSFIIGQSFSKYIRTVTMDGTAEIATWNFRVNETAGMSRKIELKSTYNNDTLVGNKIAPGTTGSFKIVVDAGISDVGVDYQSNFIEKSQKPTNLKFIYNNVEYSNLSDLENIVMGTINANDTNRRKEYAFEWKWDYQTGNNEEEIEQNDIIDTQEAVNLGNYYFEVVITGTQAIPTM